MARTPVADAVVRRTQADRREQSGRGLVQAVVEIVSERGVSAATFEAIGARANYSRSLVTQRFGSKRGLIDAVIQQAAEKFDALLLEQRTHDRPGTERTGLDGLLLGLDVYLTELTTSGELRAYFMLLSSAVAELNELRSAFAAQHERVRDHLADFVAKGQADGSIRREIDANAAALMIGSLQLGLSMQILVDPTMDLEPIRRMALSTLRLSFAAVPPA
jgi:AcrR family transcriptional regulator